MKFPSSEEYLYSLYLSGGQSYLSSLAGRMKPEDADTAEFGRRARAVLAQLQGKGYVKTEICDDQQDMVVRLTKAGEALAEAAADIQSERILNDWNSRYTSRWIIG